MDGLDETVDAPYLVPRRGAVDRAHSSTYVLRSLGTALLIGAPVATLGRREVGDAGLWLGLLPIVLATPFALPMLDPPAEHGALRLLAFLAQKVGRNVTWRRLPPRHELAEADGLRAFWRVVNACRNRETVGLSEQPELAGLHIAEGVVHVPIGHHLEVRAIYRVPTVNLDTVSAETRRGARAKWGAVLNGLPHPIQVVIRGRHTTTLPVVERIKAHGSPQAKDLAAWLRAHLHGGELVERERYLVVPAGDLEPLSDRCASLEASLRRIGLPMERITSIDDLRGVLSGFLTPRLRQFGPAVTDISTSGHLVADGEYVRAFDLEKLPPTIVTDWGRPCSTETCR